MQFALSLLFLYTYMVFMYSLYMCVCLCIFECVQVGPTFWHCTHMKARREFQVDNVIFYLFISRVCCFFFFYANPSSSCLFGQCFIHWFYIIVFLKILLVSKHKNKEESDVHMNSSKLIINIKLQVYCSLKFIFSIIYFSCVRMHTPFLYESPHSNGKHRDKHLKSNTIINLLVDTYVPGQQTPWWIKHAANEKEYWSVSSVYQGHKLVSYKHMVMLHTILHF